MFNSRFKSLDDFNSYFISEQSCIDYLEEIRWYGNVVSPFDNTSKVYKCKDNKYRCKNTGKYFDVKTKTILQGTRIPLIYWLKTMWLIMNNPNIKSTVIADRLGINQKTAWRMKQKILIGLICK